MPSSSCSTAPDLVRHAVAVGLVVGWEPSGAVYAQITDRRSQRQRRAFGALTDNRWTPDVLLGSYYAGDYRRMQ